MDQIPITEQIKRLEEKFNDLNEKFLYVRLLDIVAGLKTELKDIHMEIIFIKTNLIKILEKVNDL